MANAHLSNAAVVAYMREVFVGQLDHAQPPIQVVDVRELGDGSSVWVRVRYRRADDVEADFDVDLEEWLGSEGLEDERAAGDIIATFVRGNLRDG